jgi:hypothetical protein
MNNLSWKVKTNLAPQQQKSGGKKRIDTFSFFLYIGRPLIEAREEIAGGPDSGE